MTCVRNAKGAVHKEAVARVLQLLVSLLEEAIEAPVQVVRLQATFGLDMLGDPVGFMRSWGTGVKDLFYLPAKAVVQRPREFGRAVAAGSASFAKNSIGAPINSIGKFVGGLERATDRALAAMDRTGRLAMWVQQNHDSLPQKAGYPQHALNEIHGSLHDPANPIVPYEGSLRDDLYGGAKPIIMPVGQSTETQEVQTVEQKMELESEIARQRDRAEKKEQEYSAQLSKRRAEAEAKTHELENKERELEEIRKSHEADLESERAKGAQFEAWRTHPDGGVSSPS